MDLNTAWFLLVGLLLAGYAVLDGFDLGVGALHPFHREERDRRAALNAIGPVWDANEVWLLAGGAAMFAAFPTVYAAVFSGFYLALMLLLFALIFRAVSLEFRGKVDHPAWRKAWDAAFFFGSLLPAVLLGTAFGNVLRGLPLAPDGTFRVTLLDLLNPYSVLIGVLTLAGFVMHGAAFLAVKTEGPLQDRASGWILRAWGAFVFLYIVAAIATGYAAPSLFRGRMGSPLFWVLLGLTAFKMASIPMAVRRRKFNGVLFCSSAVIVLTIGLAAFGLFPRLVPSTLDPADSLTVYNASSSPASLKAMMVMAALGLPLVIGATAYIYRVFKGKTAADEGY
jgi:cytochrome d ubiquinol oxidase subunit II